MPTKDIITIANAYRWTQIESKNPYMLSFRHEEDAHLRMNVYFTRMTVTIQSLQYEGGMVANLKDVDMESFEDICMNRM